MEATSLSHDMDGGRGSVYYEVVVASGGTIGGTPWVDRCLLVLSDIE